MRERVWAFSGKLISELVLAWNCFDLKDPFIEKKRMVVSVFHSTLKFHGLIADDFGISKTREFMNTLPGGCDATNIDSSRIRNIQTLQPEMICFI